MDLKLSNHALVVFAFVLSGWYEWLNHTLALSLGR